MDSFVIKKSLSLSDLKKVLNTIITISKRDDKFVLNYFVPCEKKRKKSSDLDNTMYNLIVWLLVIIIALIVVFVAYAQVTNEIIKHYQSELKKAKRGDKQ